MAPKQLQDKEDLFIDSWLVGRFHVTLSVAFGCPEKIFERYLAVTLVESLFL
jgi:hypothetical protein